MSKARYERIRVERVFFILKEENWVVIGFNNLKPGDIFKLEDAGKHDGRIWIVTEEACITEDKKSSIKAEIYRRDISEKDK